MSYRGSNPPYYISAYGLARKMGFEGTEEEWLNSLTAFYMAQKAGYTGTSEEWVKKLVDPLPEFAIGQVVTLEGGSMATVQITGTKEKPVLNFGVPRGVGMVDALPLVGGTMKGSINMQNFNINNLPEPVNDGDAVPKSYVNKILEEMTRKIEKKLSEKLALSGGTMTGEINMNGRRFYNVMTPVQDTEVAHKKYVDDGFEKSKKYTDDKVTPFGCVLTASGWVGDTTPFKQTIDIEGILGTDRPHYGPVYSENTETALAEREAFAMVDDLDTADGSVTFTCFEDKPEVNLTIQMEVHR